MVRLIYWQNAAEEQLDSTLHYYMTNFSRNSAQKLYAAIEERLETLSRYPESGHLLEGHSAIRYVQIKKSHYLYYGFNAQSLFVVGLYGTKQPNNPFL